MPRPRLTLGRLMAWVAFAAVNLAILGTIYRKAGPSAARDALRWGVALLVVTYFVSYLAYRLLRFYFAPFAESAAGNAAWAESGCMAPMALGLTVIVLLTLLMVLGVALTR